MKRTGNRFPEYVPPASPKIPAERRELPPGAIPCDPAYSCERVRMYASNIPKRGRRPRYTITD